MSSAIRPDEFSKYAPRWAREGLPRPRDTIVRLPPAPKLATAGLEEPPWRGPSPFAGDVRQWRVERTPARGTAVVPHGQRHVGFAEGLVRTAALVSFALAAMGVLGSALFPNAAKAAFQTRGRSIVETIALEGGRVLRREMSPSAKSAWRFGVLDLVPTLRAMEPATTPPDNPPAAQTATPARELANALSFVVNPDPARPQRQEEADHQQLQQPQATQVDIPQGKGTQDSERILSPEDVNRLINWGETFLAQGDVVTARGFLARGVEARDPRAALMLGGTYDPEILRRMGVVGIRPDLELAHSWYTRAAEFGSREASLRLTALAQLGR